MSRAETLFARESALRTAAENYAAWLTAGNRTTKILNEQRAALRAAAIAYAEQVRVCDRE